MAKKRNRITATMSQTIAESSPLIKKQKNVTSDVNEENNIMGKDKIKTIILKDISEKDLAILSLTENLMRENLHPIENAIAIKNILDNILKLPSSIINIIKKDNYKDINVLILINKLKGEEEMLEAYHIIKELSRVEAEKYLKNRYFSTRKTNPSLIDIKNSKSKIGINIYLKELSEEQILQLREEVENLNQIITSLSSNWNK